MNSNLNQLQPYPFQKLRQLLEGVTRNAALSPIDLQMGEPKHATPDFIRQAMIDHLDGLSTYPTTLGTPALRNSIAAWIKRRFNRLISIGYRNYSCQWEPRGVISLPRRG